MPVQSFSVGVHMWLCMSSGGLPVTSRAQAAALGAQHATNVISLWTSVIKQWTGAGGEEVGHYTEHNREGWKAQGHGNR